MKRILLFLFALVVCVPYASALEPGANDVFCRVVDVGAGLCCVISIPDVDGDGDREYILYDADNYVGGGEQSYDKIAEIIPEGSTIELMVLSHSDADHLGAVDEVCDAYTIKKVIRSGLKRTTGTWKTANDAIKAEHDDEGCLDINLKYFEYPAGATYRYGEVFVTMVCGFHKPPSDWDIKDQSERRNAGSVVIRLQYKDKAILFCGDSVGRHIDDPDDVCIAAEKFMVEMSEVIPLKSNVIVAPHHGADNGSSTRFIKAVAPKYVIFSAGHKHKHPRKATAKRYLDNGVALQNIFRTDRGDNEGGKEWPNGHGGVTDPGGDKSGDDDVDILIKGDGSVEVSYR